MSELQDLILNFLDEKIGDDPQKSSEIEMKTYTMLDMKRYINETKKKIPEITGSVLKIERVNEYNDLVYASEKWKIIQIFYDVNNRPIKRALYEDALYGRCVIADAIDRTLYDFMNGKTQKNFSVTSRR